ADGKYFFRLPNADGAILTIGNTRILYLPSLIGDTTLNGTVNGDDIGLIIGLGYYWDGTGTPAYPPHGWIDGDFDNTGQVNADDIGWIIGVGSYGRTGYARVIDNTMNVDTAVP